MVSDSELRQLIARAEAIGATINTRTIDLATASEGRKTIELVQILGVKGIGEGWKTPVIAAEQLREFIAAANEETGRWTWDYYGLGNASYQVVRTVGRTFLIIRPEVYRSMDAVREECRRLNAAREGEAPCT